MSWGFEESNAWRSFYAALRRKKKANEKLRKALGAARLESFRVNYRARELEVFLKSKRSATKLLSMVLEMEHPDNDSREWERTRDFDAFADLLLGGKGK